MIHTPETIEALEKEQIVELKRISMEVHEATTGVLETPMHSADIQEATRLRVALKLKLDESMGWIADQIADLESVKRDLRNLKGWLGSDEKRLESYFFNRLREEKKGNS